MNFIKNHIDKISIFTLKSENILKKEIHTPRDCMLILRIVYEQSYASTKSICNINVYEKGKLSTSGLNL